MIYKYFIKSDNRLNIIFSRTKIVSDSIVKEFVLNGESKSNANYFLSQLGVNEILLGFKNLS